MVCTSFFTVHILQLDVICRQTKYITNSMDHSPSETSRLSDSQETPHMLWNLKISYCVHKSNICTLLWARSIQSMQVISLRPKLIWLYPISS
jgi:hypothetical protein